MKLFISIVNHNHDQLICSNTQLSEIAQHYSIIIKSNTQASNELIEFCKNNTIDLLQGEVTKGFGENNNEVFEHIKPKVNLKKDLFLVLNPDIYISLKEIEKLLTQVKEQNSDISAINLFKDFEQQIPDNSIRYSPNIINPIKSLLKIKRNDYYDKTKIQEPIEIDWAAGSFLLIKCNIYQKLGGFDEKYFMYYEDADLCRRAHNLNFSIKYFPQIIAIHLAQHQNRNILSKHSWYYLKSHLRYFMI